MRRCLAIAGVFPPYGGAGAVRQVKLFNHLREHGWQVDVIAPRGRAGWFRDRELEAEAEALRVLRVGLPGAPVALEQMRAAAKDPARGHDTALLRRLSRVASGLRNLVAIPDEKAAWAVAALARARALLSRERYHAVFTSSLPYSCHLVGVGLRRTGGPPWVAELRDPWVGHRFRAQTTGWRRVVDERLEASVTTTADAVSVISPTMAEQMADCYGPAVAGKLHVITNGFDAGDFSERPPPAAEPFELLYVGTFDARLTPPEVFLEALTRLLRERPDLRDRVVLRVLGGADLEASSTIRRWMTEHDGQGLVRVEGFAGHRCATRAMRGAGALALCLAPGASWVLTSKVFEYMASGRPILAAVPPGDCRVLLEKCGGAAIVDSADAAGLAAQLCRLIDGREAELPPRSVAAIEEYDYARVAGRMADLLAEVSEA